MRLNPPSIFIFLISIILAALSLTMKLGFISIISFDALEIPRYMPHQDYWLAILAWMVLMIGNISKGI